MAPWIIRRGRRRLGRILYIDDVRVEDFHRLAHDRQLLHLSDLARTRVGRGASERSGRRQLDSNVASDSLLDDRRHGIALSGQPTRQSCIRRVHGKSKRSTVERLKGEML